jgi:hypothetical protein
VKQQNGATKSLFNTHIWTEFGEAFAPVKVKRQVGMAGGAPSTSGDKKARRKLLKTESL